MDGQFVDSTYGSYLSGQSSGSCSSSSLTMSLSESELLEDQPSTSGCSSGIAHPANVASLKERKKAQVKEYLRQLKAMVPPSGKRRRGRSGTINALQHVLDSFKKIQEEKTDPALEKNIDVSESGIGSSVYDTDDQIKVTTTVSKQDQLVILISPGDMAIVDVSSNLKDILGYPIDSWKNRDLLNFVNKKDVAIVNSRLTHDFGDSDDLPEFYEADDGSKMDSRSEQSSGRKTFYFRMRHFKGLDSGFSLKQADSYITFQVTVDVKYMDQVDFKRTASPLLLLCPKEEKELVVHDRPKKVKYLQLNCVPLASAYADDGTVSNRTFHTRHTLLSSYSYIHPSAIQLTGFLPHEMVGTSIFDYYHPDDMAQLYDIYKQVLSSKGTPIRSEPVRFRVKNGDYIVVETEWSSFVNPWSHHLEFIIGQHSVIKGPTNVNVFDDTIKQNWTDVPEIALKYQQMIRDLLIKPINSRVKEVLGDSVAKNDDIRKENKTGVPPTDKGTEEGEKITDISEKQRKGFEMSVSPEDSEQSSSGLICENDCSMAYEQLNYTNNIKKFLLSQPMSLSSESDKKESCPSSPEEDEEVSDFDVDISVPKPPSFGSSTKVLVSEQEPREDIPGSPAHPTEEALEELSLKEAPVTSLNIAPISVPDRQPECDHHSQISLTQQALYKHTKLQEKLFIEQAKDDRNMVVFKRNDRASLLSDSSPQRVKRVHSPDRASNERAIRANKSSKLKKRNILDPPFPITTTDMKLTSIHQTFPQYQTEMQGSSSVGMNMPPDPAGMYGTNVPFVPVDFKIPNSNMAGSSMAKTNVTTTCTNAVTTETAPPTSMNNLQWPYYQQSVGVKLIPQVVSGFYQPGTGIFHTVNTISLSMQEFTSTNSQLLQPTSGLTPNYTQATYTDTTTYTNADYQRVGFKRPLSSDNSSSADETSSSLLYFLESGSQSHSSSVSHEESAQRKVAKIPKDRKRPSEPPWLMQVKWTKDVEMRYIMPKRKLGRVLMSDKEELCRTKQPDIVIHQMKELESEIDSQTSQAFDEETDYLFLVDEKSNDSNDSQDSFTSRDIVDCEDYDHDHGISSLRLAANFQKKMTIDSRRMTTEESSSSLLTENDSKEKDENSVNLIKREESPVSCGSEQGHHDISAPKSDGESESVEMESICSKASSELTPSDQRSNEEAGSSMKESDSSSKDSDNGHRDSSESEMECKREDMPNSDNRLCYDKFFIHIPVHFKGCDKTVPPWLMETEMNDKVAMEYRLKAKDLDEILKSDEKNMENLTQSNLVVKQFSALLCDIQGETNISKSGQQDSNISTTKDEGNAQAENNEDLFGQFFDSLFTSFPGTGEMEKEQTNHEPFEDILD